MTKYENLDVFRKRMKNICNEGQKLFEEHTEHRISFYRFDFEDNKLTKIGEWLLKPLPDHIFGNPDNLDGVK